MFRAERLVKCRMRSISPTSGSGGGSSARWSAGSRSATAAVDGTSHAGSRWERRPGRDSSKIRSVDCVLFIVLLRKISERLLNIPDPVRQPGVARLHPKRTLGAGTATEELMGDFDLAILGSEVQ